MKKHIWIFLAAVLTAIIMSGCSRPYPSGLDGLQWERIEPATDSMTLLLENKFYHAEASDSIMATVDSMGRHALRVAPDQRRAIEARVHFWTARLLGRESEVHRAATHIGKARKLCDSSRYPYTYRRIGIVAEDVEPGTNDNEIRRQMENLEYFTKIDDRPMEAATCILIGLILSDSYQQTHALKYLYRADSISRELGLTLWQKKNLINISECLYKTGDSVKARMILSQLLADTAIRKDFHTYNVVLRNASLHLGDPKYVREAYRRTMEKDSLMPVNAIYELLLSRIYLRSRQHSDTILSDEYGRRSFARIGGIENWDLKSEILLDAAERHARNGNRDSAYICQSRYIAAKDTDNRLQHSVEVSRIHNMKEISHIESEKESNRQKYIARLLILSIVVLLLIGVAIYIEARHRHRHRIEEQKHISDTLKSQLEIERYQRQFLAMSLAIEDTDKSLSEIKDRVNELQKEGKINDREARQVENVIKRHTAQRDDWNRFRELFDKIHPLFLKNLNETYPGLSETQVRMATYIYTGMDNKQIAEFLNIRVESVKQSRWRMRVKMGLQASDSLEDALRSLCPQMS